MVGRLQSDETSSLLPSTAQIVNIKYRHLPKTFWQSSGAEKILYGYDDAIREDTVIIVEGEIDKLSLNQVGIWNVVSVPDGAPAKAQPEGSRGFAADFDPQQDVKFSYVWQVGEWRGRDIIVTAHRGPEAPGRLFLPQAFAPPTWLQNHCFAVFQRH